MNNRFTKRFVNILRSLVTQNDHINMKIADFSHPFISEQVRTHGVNMEKQEILEGFKGVQRILRLLPDNKAHLVWPVLLSGFSSALEIAALGRNAFIDAMREDADLDEETAAYVHRNARARRSRLLPEIMNRIQNSEPHIRQAKF